MKKIIQCHINENHWYSNHASACPWCILSRQSGIDPFPLDYQPPHQHEGMNDTGFINDTSPNSEPQIIRTLHIDYRNFNSPVVIGSILACCLLIIITVIILGPLLSQDNHQQNGNIRNEQKVAKITVAPSVVPHSRDSSSSGSVHTEIKKESIFSIPQPKNVKSSSNTVNNQVRSTNEYDKFMLKLSDRLSDLDYYDQAIIKADSDHNYQNMLTLINKGNDISGLDGFDSRTKYVSKLFNVANENFKKYLEIQRQYANAMYDPKLKDTAKSFKKDAGEKYNGYVKVTSEIRNIVDEYERGNTDVLSLLKPYSFHD